ncbi:MAG: ABC transporter ATP-binding protein [Phycisphaerales bacterium]|nr:MAG: ABC transporter ATP-binding protein [Phycisphaerales bacterium]
MLRAIDVRKTYRLGRVNVPVLRGASMDVQRGEWVAILGASGSGKSTLLHLLGGLDRPDAPPGGGEIRFEGTGLRDMSRRALDQYRRRRVGFIFQFYHLLPELNVMENTLLSAMAAHSMGAYAANRGGLRARAESLLGAFGLAERLRHRPAELSGGERQRVAIARALMNEPDVLLADEPTGNLDRKTGDAILDRVAALRGETGQTIVMVTHDEEVARRADRVVRLEDGVVVRG